MKKENYKLICKECKGYGYKFKEVTKQRSQTYDCENCKGTGKVEWKSN